MSFLLVRPYVRKGTRLETDLVTAGGTYQRNAIVNDKIWKSLGYTRLKLHVTGTPKVKRELEYDKVRLYNIGGKSGFHYTKSGDAGYTFTVHCIIRKNDIVHGVTGSGFHGEEHRVWSYLQYYYTIGLPVSVVVEALIIPNGVYRISDFTSYDVIGRDFYECDIEFTTWKPKAVKVSNKVTVLQSNLKRCKKPSVKVVTGKEIDKGSVKPNACLKLVNKVLYGLGCLSKANYEKWGAYWTNASHRGLVNYKKRWNKRGLSPTLNTSGLIDNNTWNALINYPKLK